jgi:polysaccharide biosynthesis transport protein
MTATNFEESGPEALAQVGSDFREQLALIWRRKWIVLACVIIFPVAAYLISSRAPKVYKATTLLAIQPESIDTTLMIAAVPPSGTPDQSIAAAASTATTSGVLVPATGRIKPPIGPTALRNKLSVTTDPTSGFLSISATDHSGPRAARIANAVAGSLVTVEANQGRRQINQAVLELGQELGRLTPSDGGRSQIQDQLQRLRALGAVQRSNARIVQSASIPTSPVSPRPSRDTAFALLAGILVGIGLASLLNRLDRKVRDPTDLEQITGLPILGRIPAGAFRGREGDRAVDDAFQTLRSSLVYFNVDRPIKSIVVASGIPSEGKTTVAVDLAHAFARTGKHVVLIDADLRYAHEDSRVGGSVSAGLGAVLAGEATADETLLSHNGFDLLPSGPAPPNPSELIASNGMRNLIQMLSARFDLVIIDTPAGLAVGDAIPLFKEASGVLLVGRVGFSTRDAVSRFASVVRSSRGVLLGAVATGVKSNAGYGYGYGRKRRYARRRSRNGRSRQAPESVDSSNGWQSSALAPNADRVVDER